MKHVANLVVGVVAIVFAFAILTALVVGTKFFFEHLAVWFGLPPTDGVFLFLTTTFGSAFLVFSYAVGKSILKEE